MKKEQLLQLIDLGVFDNNDDGFNESVLDLTDEQLKIIFKYGNIDGMNYQSLIRDVPDWNFVLNLASKFHNEEQVEAFMMFATNKHLRNSAYYDYTLLNLMKIINDDGLVEFCACVLLDENLLNSKHYKYIAELLFTKKLHINLEMPNYYICILLNEELLNSEYYQFVVARLLNIRNVDCIDKFGDIACNFKLMQSAHYKWVVDSIALIEDERILNCFVELVEDEGLLNSIHFKYIFDLCLNITDWQYFTHFISLITDKDLLKYIKYQAVVDLAYKIEKVDLLSMFVKIAIKKKLLEKECYQSIIERVSKIDSVMCLTQINRMLDSDDFLYSDYLEYAIDLITEIGNCYNFEPFAWLAQNYILLKSKDYKNVLELASNIKSPLCLEKFGLIATNHYIIDTDIYLNLVTMISKVENPNTMNVINKIISKVPNDMLNSLVPRIISLDYDDGNLIGLIDLINNHQCNREMKDELYRILEILKFDNKAVIEDLVDKYCEKLAQNVLFDAEINKKDDILNIEDEIKNYKLSNILARPFTRDVMKDMISNTFNDEQEINSKTLIKVK